MAITHTKGTLHGTTKDEKLYPKNFSDQVLNNNMQPATTTATTENKQVARDAQGNFVYAQPNVPQTDLTFSETPNPEAKNLGSIIVTSDGVTDTYNVAGSPGEQGKSAYQVAVDNGYTGTESEWLASLKGTDGTNGHSIGSVEGSVVSGDEAVNTYTLHLDDTAKTPLSVPIQVKNGSKGTKGDAGNPGDRLSVSGTTLNVDASTTNTIIEANNGLETTESLESLRVGSTNYSMPKSVEVVTALPQVSEIEYNKHKLYLSGNEIKYIIKKTTGSTVSYEYATLAVLEVNQEQWTFTTDTGQSITKNILVAPAK